MGYLHTRFLLLQCALSACNTGGVVSDVENAFLAAIVERAHSTDLTVHTKQREFFELWWTNPTFKVQCLRPVQRSRLANAQKDILAFINKNRFKWDKGKLRAMKIVAKLLMPTLSVVNSRQLSNPAFKLSFGRGKDLREYINDRVFNEIVVKLKDMACVQAVGEMFDKLGVSEALADEPL